MQNEVSRGYMDERSGDPYVLSIQGDSNES